ncbi:MAG: hypothetical protein HW390_2904 [Candidatus Brocadiaceae bacterium]|nr:hypothetical protein [Candidatus Brocadiaceae bacterium]
MLVENNRRNSISSVGTIYYVEEQLGFKYIMPTAFLCLYRLLFLPIFCPYGTVKKIRLFSFFVICYSLKIVTASHNLYHYHHNYLRRKKGAES